MYKHKQPLFVHNTVFHNLKLVARGFTTVTENFYNHLFFLSLSLFLCFLKSLLFSLSLNHNLQLVQMAEL